MVFNDDEDRSPDEPDKEKPKPSGPQLRVVK
jgi:hypothetical protein